MDLGGVTKEFFYSALSAIVTKKYDEKYAILQGNENHKLPSLDSALLRAGVFKAIGKLFAHSLIHTGVGAFGLSPAVVTYLCTENVDYETDFNFSLEDISSYSVLTAIQIVSNCHNYDNYFLYH